MTHGEAALAFGVGLVLVTLGLFLALGPWALVGVGVLTAAGALLLPTREKASAAGETGEQTPANGW
jgi:hypothetical protein